MKQNISFQNTSSKIHENLKEKGEILS